MKNIHKLIIIGSGPAGLTAGIYAARANLKPVIITGSKPGGQLMSTFIVENWPGQTQIQGPQLMINMQEHAQHFGCIMIEESVKEVNFKQKPFSITTDKGQQFNAESIIIATGASPKKLNVPGEDMYWGKGVSTCAVCDGAFYKDKPVIIVGGGDTAMENASFLLNFTDKITIVQILDQLSAFKGTQFKILNNPKINFIYNATVSEIKGNNEQIQSVIIKKKDGTNQEVETAAVFIAIGLNPNIEPFKNQIAINNQGFIEIHDHTKTNIPGIFAVGDVVDYRYRQAITAAGTGCMAALDAERFLKSEE